MGIKYLVRFAKAEMIYEMPYSKEEGAFKIPAKGRYGLWLSGKMFKKGPLGEFGFKLIKQDTRQVIPLCQSIARTTMNGLDTARTELYCFHAEAGDYILALTDEASLKDKLVASAANVISRQDIDYSLFSIQVYKKTFAALTVLCVLGIIAGLIGTASGIILSLALK